MDNSKIKILIADDSPTVVEMIRFILEEKGYTTVVAADGVEAINRVYQEKPDLILLDILMPKMNGYQVCRLLKGNKDTAFIPVIMLAASEQKSDEFWGIATGADEFFTKDLAMTQLAGTIEKILKIKPYLDRQAPSRPFKKKEISSEEILSRVNNLLDKKLFESTVINEISKIASSIYDYEETAKSILILLSRIVYYEVGALLIEEVGEKKLSMLLNAEVNADVVKKISKKMIDEINKEKPQEKRKLGSFKTKIFNEEYQKESATKKLKAFFSVTLKARGGIIGILALASSKESSFSKENLDTLTLMADQISMVINNVCLYQKINYLSITDGLTELYNYRYFQDMLKREFERARRYEFYLSLIMIDIDHFKKVNDSYGHQQGDIILRELGIRFKKEVRERLDTPVRYGGEEFAFILPNTGKKGAFVVADRIRERIAEYKFPGRDKPLRITLSLGVASYPAKGIEKFADLVKKADEALYRSKQEGRNKVSVYEEKK
ncbi:diguanylate cyclase [bacterium]|nr:diguanylate cyclase [bacterium]